MKTNLSNNQLKNNCNNSIKNNKHNLIINNLFEIEKFLNSLKTSCNIINFIKIFKN